MADSWVEKVMRDWDPQYATKVRDALAEYPLISYEAGKEDRPEAQALALLVYAAPIPPETRATLERMDEIGGFARRAWYMSMCMIYERTVLALTPGEFWNCYHDYWDDQGIDAPIDEV